MTIAQISLHCMLKLKSLRFAEPFVLLLILTVVMRFMKLTAHEVL